MKFCKFASNWYSHISTTFCRFILIFHQMALIFFMSNHRFHPVKFWVGLFTQNMKMQLFGNDVIFFVCPTYAVSDNCKQSITVIFTSNVLLTLSVCCQVPSNRYWYEATTTALLSRRRGLLLRSQRTSPLYSGQTVQHFPMLTYSLQLLLKSPFCCFFCAALP